MDKRAHQREKVRVVIEVSGRHKSHGVEIWSENVRILINGSILNNLLSLTPYLYNLAKATIKEEDLQVETPALHVLVKVVEVGVVIYILVLWLPVVVF